MECERPKKNRAASVDAEAVAPKPISAIFRTINTGLSGVEIIAHWQP